MCVREWESDCRNGPTTRNMNYFKNSPVWFFTATHSTCLTIHNFHPVLQDYTEFAEEIFNSKKTMNLRIQKEAECERNITEKNWEMKNTQAIKWNLLSEQKSFLEHYSERHERAMEGKLRVINNVNIKMDNILQFVKVFFNVCVWRVCRLKKDLKNYFCSITSRPKI